MGIQPKPKPKTTPVSLDVLPDRMRPWAFQTFRSLRAVQTAIEFGGENDNLIGNLQQDEVVVYKNRMTQDTFSIYTLVLGIKHDDRRAGN